MTSSCSLYVYILVFGRIQQTGLKLKPSKCHFETTLKNEDCQFVIILDASKEELRAVLTQVNEKDKLRLLYFASRRCNPAKSRYGSIKLESLAIKFTTSKFAQFIIMIPTII